MYHTVETGERVKENKELKVEVSDDLACTQVCDIIRPLLIPFRTLDV